MRISFLQSILTYNVCRALHGTNFWPRCLSLSHIQLEFFSDHHHPLQLAASYRKPNGQARSSNDTRTPLFHVRVADNTSQRCYTELSQAHELPEGTAILRRSNIQVAYSCFSVRFVFWVASWVKLRLKLHCLGTLGTLQALMRQMLMWHLSLVSEPQPGLWQALRVAQSDQASAAPFGVGW